MENTRPSSQPATLQAAAAGSTHKYGNAASPPSSSLHSVRKPPAKPWKKPAAAPIPPKVYRVDPRGFRQLVQRLTGATDLAPRRLRGAAPVPLDVASRQFTTVPQLVQQPAGAAPAPAYLQGGTLQQAFPAGELPPPQTNLADAAGYQSLGYTAGVPSPSLYSACLTWCNLPLLSPGSMACLEQSSVL